MRDPTSRDSSRLQIFLSATNIILAVYIDEQGVIVVATLQETKIASLVMIFGSLESLMNVTCS
jgi:hypothetical protein